MLENKSNIITGKHHREDRILRTLFIPKILEYVSENNGFVAGGAVRGVFTSDHVNDLDIFFKDAKDFNKDGQFDNGFETQEDGGHKILFYKTDVAWTHKPEFRHQKLPLHQMICAVFGSPEEVIKQFDFTMSMAAWIPQTGEFIMDEYFLKHCSQKRLVFNINAQYPICSMWRAVKFIKRGWKLPAIDCIKLALKINNLDFKNKGELKRQLMGIDTSFLRELTDALENDKEGAYDFGEAIEKISTLLDED